MLSFLRVHCLLSCPAVSQPSPWSALLLDIHCPITYSDSWVTFNLNSLGNEPVFSHWSAYSWSLHILLLSFHVLTCEVAYIQELSLIPDGRFVQKLDWKRLYILHNEYTQVLLSTQLWLWICKFSNMISVSNTAIFMCIIASGKLLGSHVFTKQLYV